MEKYALGKKLGQGSFGTAYVVKDKNGKQFVMKQIDTSKMTSNEKKEARNEVTVLSALKHPYIVSFRESFMDRSYLCIVMDFAEHGDLYGRIDSVKKGRKTFTEPQILRWTAQVSLALKYMHDKHILHRDLKSQNLFLASGDTLKVGDFGISKVLECTQACARTTIGTPYYLSPEICQEKPYSWASDIWALGCLLYELCALKVPFDGPNIKALVNKITRDPAPVIPSRYSSELIQLGKDLLQKDHRQRPTADAILAKPLIQGEIRQMLQEHSREQSGPSSAAPSTPAKPQKPSSEARRQSVDESDSGSVLFAVELTGGPGIKREAVGRKLEHTCRKGMASGTTMRLGRNHQLSFWKEVCKPDTVGYISRDQFDVQVSGTVGALIFTLVNKSSNGIDIGSSKLESKGQTKSLAPDEWLVLNTATEYEVHLRFTVGPHPDAGSAVRSRPPVPEKRAASPRLGNAGREVVQRQGGARAETPGRPGPPGRALSTPRLKASPSRGASPGRVNSRPSSRQASPAGGRRGAAGMPSTPKRGQSPGGWR
eukprot:CAMPEP_0204392830 /NCGR_PEP_ID=MMETSP0469-20131031/61978_1 /ASSEMBLY_ACC=CAM_ASM_000384 /TAXON_ID=2969 /ORGANISM="Oxyrrhis marina" /LENGTH=540 /DNA_ID=CAMNT_0051386851 /DNA_START=40 /DNA_END=1662 /DNA_ORIENTATION=+